MDPRQRLAALNPAKQAFTLFDEFKNFAFKGNVIDLAVGVIIGAAFSGIIKSLVDNLIMPLIGLIPAFDKGYQNWAYVIGEGDARKVVPYGKFIGDVVNFLVIAFVLFIFVVKFLGWLMRSKKEEAAAPPPPLTKEQELLTEIRDLLRKERGEVGVPAGPSPTTPA
jgi:large conductance mechanosensitive channel